MATKILTMDESKTVRLIIAKAFAPLDCEVLEAANGVEGLALALKHKPDVIILDLNMPVMDGYETLTKLKISPALKSIPVVMLTAEAGRESVLRVARMGVRDYLVKPFKEDVLVDRIGRIIELRRKGEASIRTKRPSDPIAILVVDDKTAIHEQIRVGLAETSWFITATASTSEAIEYCSQNSPDVILLSLSLPENTGFAFFHMLRAGRKTKAIPIFALCVKAAVEEHTRLQEIGFAGIITKPIDFAAMKDKISQVLRLDVSGKYFLERDGTLVLKLPANFNGQMAKEISTHLRAALSAGVDSGLKQFVWDLTQLTAVDLTVIMLGADIAQICEEHSLQHQIVASQSVSKECRSHEQAKNWSFAVTFDEALASFQAKELVHA